MLTVDPSWQGSQAQDPLLGAMRLAAQGTQIPPSEEKVPGGQMVQLVRARLASKPQGHLMHSAAPGTLVIEPGGQNWQVPASLEKKPASQSSQESPSAETSEPTSQEMHSQAPAVIATVLAGHLWQVDPPSE